MKHDSRKTKLLLVLSAIFITSAITAEFISSKIIMLHFHIGSLNLGTYAAAVGILPWPIAFLVTDTINEFYGRDVVKRLSVTTCCMIAFAFIIVYAALQFHNILPTPTDDEFFHTFSPG